MSRRLLTALVAALFALANSTPALALQTAPQKQPLAKKVKKVWTNEDLEALRPSGVVSSGVPVAPPAAEAASPAGEPAEKADAKKQEIEEDPIEKLRKRLEPLRTELDSIEAQLRSLRQGASSGRTSGGGMDVSKTSGAMNTGDQIALLEKRRADLLGQISAIEDEARRKSIAPGAIR
ncbi:MAG: hypothetical protein M1453_13915 [Acidobacteria bacterium]|nr:hypothetical protein [Acidobacteriota bacterium]MCL5289076.1 hypothetical protein [Acidobacteriota bacterium]